MLVLADSHELIRRLLQTASAPARRRVRRAVMAFPWQTISVDRDPHL
jgi:hypothetical protein